MGVPATAGPGQTSRRGSGEGETSFKGGQPPQPPLGPSPSLENRQGPLGSLPPHWPRLGQGLLLRRL